MIDTNECSSTTYEGKEYDTFTEPPILMKQERAKTSFPTLDVTHYLNGGEKETTKFEAIKRQIEMSPVFDNSDYYDVNGDYKKCRERTMQKVAAIAEIVTDGRSEQDINLYLSAISIVDPQSHTRIGVHFGLFLSGVRSGGTPEQFNYWIEQGAGGLRNFFGCFCMTEMGHGSNVAGLETTATYDESTEEFIINTPSTAATKWWIGGLAHTATHGLVYARLLIKGKDYGVKQFVVPLRDRNNWNLLPGIGIGDIGKKLGRDGIDNGWVQFSNVRIPRLFMLMKYNRVAADGTVESKAPAQLSYGALIGGRVTMVRDSYTWASRYLTIAIRYAAIRRQFAQGSTVETKLLDYTYHQRRLLPRLAYAYAMNAASRHLQVVYNNTTETLASTNPKNKEAMDAAVGEAKALFALSAGLKAFSTWGTLGIIDECRQACGGHGYSAYNGFIDWTAFAVQVTWEGDNNILALSTGRALISRNLEANTGPVKDDQLGSGDISQPSTLVRGWNLVAAKVTEQATIQYKKLEKSGLEVDSIWEKLSQLRFKVARINTRSFLVKSFFEQVEKSASPATKKVLTELATLFALWSIEEEASVFLEFKFVTAEDLSQISLLVDEYCGKIREQAIGLTDSFNWSDYFINAPIGNYDGDVYRNYFRKITDRNPRSETHAPYFLSVMQPFFKRTLDDDPDLSSLEEEEREINEE